ncbi:hypothetical protein [Streptomyces sp. NPDC048111]|uniref:hypothetical protein n=1 Tax=Streptomyces sp. NPDC048111 TaxID=3365500 RepID=UPI003723BA6E
MRGPGRGGALSRASAAKRCLQLARAYLVHFELPALQAVLTGRARGARAREELLVRLSHRLFTSGLARAGLVLHGSHPAPVLPADRPVIVLVRHAGPFNTQLLALLAGHALGRDLISVGRLLPAGDPAVALLLRPLRVALIRWNRHGPARAMRFLIRQAQALGPRDALAFFPEGAHMSAGRRRAALAALHASDPERALWARRLKHVLPPVSAGAARVIAQAAAADVVIVGHTGLEDPLSCLTDLGYPPAAGGRVHLAWWHTPAAEVPREPAAIAAWLDRRWAAMDEWIARARLPAGAPVLDPARRSTSFPSTSPS